MQRMDHVGLAGFAHLALVRVGGHAIGFLELGEIFFRAQLADLLFELGVKLLQLSDCWDYVCGHLFLGYLVLPGFSNFQPRHG